MKQCGGVVPVDGDVVVVPCVLVAPDDLRVVAGESEPLTNLLLLGAFKGHAKTIATIASASPARHCSAYG